MEDPKHGFRGTDEPDAPPAIPGGLTLCISRESGARGGSIGRRVGQELGWQVYDSEMVLHAARQGDLLAEMGANDRQGAEAWIQKHLEKRLGSCDDSEQGALSEIARPVLELAAMGNVVLIGRGAGFILPRDTTLHVRMTSPWEDRVAYLSQWFRLTPEEASQRAAQLDAQREDYLKNQLGADLHSPASYDLILCTSRLGEDTCAQIIQLAVQSRIRQRWGEPENDFEISPA